MEWRRIVGGFALALWLGAAPGPAADSVPPRAGAVVNLTADELTNNEVSLAVNPTNPLNLLAGWNDWQEHQGVGYAYSFDGGRTWSRPALIPGVVAGDHSGDGGGLFQVAGDPAFVFGPDGTAYAALQAFNVTPPFEAGLLVAVSTDGGRSWPRLLAAYSGYREEGEGGQRRVPDRAAAAVDSNPTSPFFGALYVAFGQEQDAPGTASVLLTYLRPGADRFSSPVAVTDLPAGFTQNVALLAGPNGTLYVIFVAQEPGATTSGTFLVESRDGGRTFGPPHLVARFWDPVDGRLPNTAYRVSSFPVGVFDPAHSQLVVAWNDRMDGVSSLLVSTASPLDLDRWSAPARITPASTGEQFFPAISASPDGRLDLVFYDRSRDPGNRLNFVTYAWSRDGGRTWESMNVTRAPFDGEAQTTPGGTRFIGDYIGVASTSAAAHIAWTGNGKDSACACNQDIFTIAVSHAASADSGPR